MASPRLRHRRCDGWPDVIAYVEQVLEPILRRGDTVFLVNLRTDNIASVHEGMEAADARVRYLPAYPPDLNPIDMVHCNDTFLATTEATKTHDVDLFRCLCVFWCDW